MTLTQPLTLNPNPNPKPAPNLNLNLNPNPNPNPNPTPNLNLNPSPNPNPNPSQARTVWRRACFFLQLACGRVRVGLGVRFGVGAAFRPVWVSGVRVERLGPVLGVGVRGYGKGQQSCVRGRGSAYIRATANA